MRSRAFEWFRRSLSSDRVGSHDACTSAAWGATAVDAGSTGGGDDDQGLAMVVVVVMVTTAKTGDGDADIDDDENYSIATPTTSYNI